MVVPWPLDLTLALHSLTTMAFLNWSWSSLSLSSCFDGLSALPGLLQGDLESIMHSLAFHKSPDLSGANVFVGSVVDQFRPKNGLVQEFLNLRTIWVSPRVFDANAFGSFFPQFLALSVDLVVQGVKGF